MPTTLQPSPANPSESAPAHVLFAEAFRFWLKLGFISFGGPAGQIAVMHEELVERRRWISERRFLHALNYCMLRPGPEAQKRHAQQVQAWRLDDDGAVVTGPTLVIEHRNLQPGIVGAEAD